MITHLDITIMITPQVHHWYLTTGDFIDDITDDFPVGTILQASQTHGNYLTDSS